MVQKKENILSKELSGVKNPLFYHPLPETDQTPDNTKKPLFRPRMLAIGTPIVLLIIIGISVSITHITRRSTPLETRVKAAESLKVSLSSASDAPVFHVLVLANNTDRKSIAAVEVNLQFSKDVLNLTGYTLGDFFSAAAPADPEKQNFEWSTPLAQANENGQIVLASGAFCAMTAKQCYPQQGNSPFQTLVTFHFTQKTTGNGKVQLTNVRSADYTVCDTNNPKTCSVNIAAISTPAEITLSTQRARVVTTLSPTAQTSATATPTMKIRNTATPTTKGVSTPKITMTPKITPTLTPTGKLKTTSTPVITPKIRGIER